MGEGGVFGSSALSAARRPQIVASRNSPRPDDTRCPWTICQSNDCIRAKMPCLACAKRRASTDGFGHAPQRSPSQQLQQQQNGPQTNGPQHSKRTAAQQTTAVKRATASAEATAIKGSTTGEQATTAKRSAAFDREEQRMTEASQPAALEWFADAVPHRLRKPRLPQHRRPEIGNRIEGPDLRAGADRSDAHGFPPRLKSSRTTP